MRSNSKRIVSLFLSLALVLGMLLVPMENKAFAEGENVKKITIVHVNDVHGRIKEGDYDGMGFGRMATKVNKLKEENPNLILLNAGDTIHGLPIVTISQGETMIRLMNEMGFDAMVPGNHDFNYGYDRLVGLKDVAEFPIIGANIIKEDGTKDFEEYIIKEIDGVKVGIFGLTTQETKYKANPLYTEGVNFVDPIETAKSMVDKLKEENVDIIIALAHIGVADDADPSTIDIAEKVEGIDIIVDGHSHTEYPEGKVVGDSLIVQAGDHLKNIGIVNVELTDGEITKKEATLFTKEEGMELEEDEEIKKVIESLDEEIKPIMDKVIGKTKVRLDGEREIVRTGESNLGNLLADSVIKHTKADAVILNGGDIRTTIEVGEITKGDILTMLPFGSYGVLLEIKGIDILNAIENGVSVYPDTFGGFPHVAGMTFTFDPSKEVGNRVDELIIQGEPVDLNKTYKLVTNNFLAEGGDKYDSLKNGTLVAEYEALEEILINYIQELGEVDIKTEGRIVAKERKEEPELVVPDVKPDTKPDIKLEIKPDVKEEIYVVNPGDVLWKIAEKFGKTWEELAKYNKLKNPHLIFPGQKILVPVK